MSAFGVTRRDGVAKMTALGVRALDILRVRTVSTEMVGAVASEASEGALA